MEIIKMMTNLLEWIFDDADEYGYTYKCSQCKHLIFIKHKNSSKPTECVHCGAKNKENKELIL